MTGRAREISTNSCSVSNASESGVIDMNERYAVSNTNTKHANDRRDNTKVEGLDCAVWRVGRPQSILPVGKSLGQFWQSACERRLENPPPSSALPPLGAGHGGCEATPSCRRRSWPQRSWCRGTGAPPRGEGSWPRREDGGGDGDGDGVGWVLGGGRWDGWGWDEFGWVGMGGRWVGMGWDGWGWVGMRWMGGRGVGGCGWVGYGLGRMGSFREVLGEVGMAWDWCGCWSGSLCFRFFAGVEHHLFGPIGEFPEL